MTNPPKPSALEQVAGNIVTESALTVIAAVVGGPLAPLLPVLAKSLAAGRHQRRVEATLTEIRESLARQEELVTNLTDEQYKLVNETVLAVLQTTQAEKLLLLRNAVQNALTLQGVQAREAAILSRIIRDISAEEASFLLRTFEHEGVKLGEAAPDQQVMGNTLRVDPKSHDALNVSGLLSLGLLTNAEATWDGLGLMRFSGIAGKVIALLRAPSA